MPAEMSRVGCAVRLYFLETLLLINILLFKYNIFLSAILYANTFIQLYVCLYEYTLYLHFFRIDLCGDMAVG